MMHLEMFSLQKALALGAALVLLTACGGGGGGGGGSVTFRVTAVTPAANSTTGEDPDVIEVTFNRDVDKTTVTAASFQLAFSGGDGSFGESNEILIQPLIEFPTNRRIRFDLANIPLPQEVFRLRLIGDGVDALRSVDNDLLDGDRDNVPGGTFELHFRTTTAVLGMTPSPGSVLSSSPAFIEVTLTPDANPISVSDGSFFVLGSGGDGTFDDGNEIRIRPDSVTALGGGVFRFTPASPLSSDTYQVRLAAEGAGRALRFNPARDQFAGATADPSLLPMSGSWTVECWAKLDDVARANPLVTMGDGAAGNGYVLGQDVSSPQNGSFLALLEGAVRSLEATGGPVPVAGQWNHVALVYDSLQGELHLYVNGVRTDTDSTGVTGLINPSGDFLVGRSEDGASSVYFDGEIDEVRLWAGVRTGAEIRRDRYRRLDGGETNITGYWKFDELLGQITADFSMGGNGLILGADTGEADDDPLRISSTAWPQVADTSGNLLDGEFTGSFPSGTASPGSDFVTTFEVS
ncbi:MAG: LamG domain-containing protein [Planctomycetota bacterium]